MMEGNEVLRQHNENQSNKEIGKQRDDMMKAITELLQEDNYSNNFKNHLSEQKRKLSFQYVPLSYEGKMKLLTDIGNSISQYLETEYDI
jgi:hypothetical protein